MFFSWRDHRELALTYSDRRLWGNSYVVVVPELYDLLTLGPLEVGSGLGAVRVCVKKSQIH